ncbi:MAG: sigma-54-dependent Fis family transcriptional regulator [Planctomycetota bacterium]|nr:MAG: sigma-54-dependent Fis family transcriptional regulator [Planctomycetota bacterium]
MPIRSAVVADDEFLNRDLMEEILSRMQITVRTAKDGVQALRALEEEPADLLITDIRMPGMGGLKLLHKAAEKWPGMPVVMMTAYASVESAVESMRQGAYDYLMKPFGVEQVEALLLRLNERQQLLREVVVLREESRDRHRARNFLGQTPVMEDVFDVISRAARSQATVLVNGESGTGKELVARSLHEQSHRNAGPFIKVNCAALTETLLASELFGHEKGSFTGADNQRIGRFELADGGTILLDEISEISPELQAKLLRVLEERQFERVGGEHTITVDVRVVATTNRDLPEEVAAGRFREDLYYRLNVIPVEMPPLRDRGDDIAQILHHYLKHFGEELGCKPSFTDDGLELLCAYRWPGNVRELVNVVERLVVLNGDAPLDAAAVRRCLPELKREGALASDTGGEGPMLSEAQAMLTLEEMERQHLQRAWECCDGDKQRCADALGITPRMLWGRLRKFGLVD